MEKNVDRIRIHIPSWSWTLLKYLISAGLVIWLILNFEWNGVFASLAHVSWTVIIGWLVIWGIAYCLMGLRLKILLAAQNVEISLFYSIQILFIGAFTGNFLPSSMGGDAFKFIYLARAGYGKSVTGASIILDRLLNILSVFMLLPFALTLPGFINMDLYQVYLILGIILVCGLILIGAGILILLRLRKMPQPPASDRRLLTRVSRIIQRLIGIFSQWIDHPWSLISATVISLGAIILCFVGGWVVAQGVNIDISLVTWMAIQACLSVLVFLPISMNGLGLQEISLVYFMSLVGVPVGKSQALALILRVLIVFFSLFGAYGLISEKKKMPQSNDLKIGM